MRYNIDIIINYPDGGDTDITEEAVIEVARDLTEVGKCIIAYIKDIPKASSFIFTVVPRPSED